MWNNWKDKITTGVKQVYKEHDNTDAIADLILVTIEGLIVKTVLENKDKDDVEKIKRLLEGL